MSNTFVIANSGRLALMITKVKPDCACTATAYDKTIPLGGQGNHGPGHQNRFRSTATLPKKPR